jgi:pimeloyl-ACP methyl ester carboxylesterase
MGGLGLIVAFAALAALLLAAGMLYQLAGSHRDARSLPPPGRLIDGMHVDILGAGAPPVIFEAGIAATSLSWALVQPQVAKLTQTVIYDRAGLGWSRSPRSPRLVWNLVDELREMLRQAQVAAPRVLVAHSYGGLIALAYTARHPAEVAALILVDPVGIGEWADPTASQRAMLGRGIFLSRCGEILARVGLVRFALMLVAAGSRRIPRLIAHASSGPRGAAFTERIAGEIRKLPREVWPAIQAHWSDPKSFRAMAAYLQALPENARAVLNAATGFDIPLVVLSAGNSSPAQRADHERVARLSTRGRLEIVADSGHWILLDRPDLVIQEIERAVSI